MYDCISFYQSASVTIALSCTIFDIFDVVNIVTLKSRLGVTHAANLCTVSTCWNLKTWFLFTAVYLHLHLHSQLRKRL